ncbi:HrpB1 family type III secretion system apparatus protein [Burkholderia oklahomensis]|uniref:Type III secretion protein HrpB1/HrpK n=1 Tax=Burkholderia oklahomensis TaxID=342113 RepID=A0AAI8BAN8_9BURK|nr:HrpB1 family type III secretion system apparatus protein [Burkholderia oklahomensis]AIO68743.1 type III secretion protein HrpB1/HrpK [Burkholderia oklahomensis]AJX34766.1 type III secretion protein HrpB1/HrpK [Burkholderia oklahomensis C6786]AOI39598.1 type III secretion protein [Burkholderia oklahomensis EO147]AOI49279.1 type III secretion protein [Burkholderia oklahomensis C6786]KUY51529.1 type III secretion protein [Burkholderia oklahomensis EO147]
MTADVPEYVQCRPEIVGGLVETVSTALLRTFPKVTVDPYDIELILDALRVMRPHVAEIQMLDGVLHMAFGRWDDAIRVLRDVCMAAPHFGYARALLAFCLSTKGDEDWKQHAAEALATTPTNDTLVLVKALHAREDLVKAVQASRNGGPFVPPQSIVELTAELEQPTQETEKPLAERVEIAQYGTTLRA